MSHIVVDPVTRIEGHLRVEAEVMNGQVEDAWSSSTMFRGIEIILRGRDPRDAWAFAQRISEHASIAISNAQLYSALTAANESKSEFMAFAAHELKNPMVTIKTFAQLLAERYDDASFGAGFQDVVDGDIARMDEPPPLPMFLHVRAAAPFQHPP